MVRKPAFAPSKFLVILSLPTSELCVVRLNWVVYWVSVPTYGCVLASLFKWLSSVQPHTYSQPLYWLCRGRQRLSTRGSITVRWDTELWGCLLLSKPRYNSKSWFPRELYNFGPVRRISIKSAFSVSTQFKPYVLFWYYGYYSIIPVVISSKLKISFQAKYSLDKNRKDHEIIHILEKLYSCKY